MTRKFKYQGPTDTSATLKLDGHDIDVILFRGSIYTLPQDHEYIKTLIALGYLAPEGDTPAAAKTQKTQATATPSNKGVK